MEERTRGRVAAGRPGGPTFMCGQTGRNNWGARQTAQPGVPAWGNKASKPLTEIPVGVEVSGETPSLTEELFGETHRVLEHTQTHPPGNQHQKSPICLWVVVEVTESQLRVKQVALLPLRPLPHIQCHNSVTWLPHPGE